MTIAQSQEGWNDDGGAAGTTITFTPANNLTPGSVILVEATWDVTNAPTVTCADATNGAYTPIDTVPDTDHGQNQKNFYFKNNSSSGKPVITVTYSASSQFKGIHFREITGAATVNPLAGHAAQFQTAPGTGTNGATSGNTGTLTGQPALICGFINDPSASTTPTAGTGFTTGTSGWGFGGTAGARSETKRVTSTAPVAATFTMGTAESSDTFAAVFLEAGATITPVDSLFFGSGTTG